MRTHPDPRSYKSDVTQGSDEFLRIEGLLVRLGHDICGGGSGESPSAPQDANPRGAHSRGADVPWRRALISADLGLAPPALRDIVAATRAGRFTVDDPSLALAVAGGSLMGLGQLLADEPGRDDAEAADRVALDMLVMFGMPADEAAEICRLPLPDLDVLIESFAFRASGSSLPDCAA
jgi:hypothetical protein